MQKNTEVKINWTGRRQVYIYKIQEIKGNAAFLWPLRTIKTGKKSSFSVQSKNCGWYLIAELEEV